MADLDSCWKPVKVQEVMSHLVQCMKGTSLTCSKICAGVKRGYDDEGHESMKRMRYDDEAALGPDGKRLHTDTSAAIPGSETVYRLLVPAKKVRAAQPYCFQPPGHTTLHER